MRLCYERAYAAASNLRSCSSPFLTSSANSSIPPIQAAPSATRDACRLCGEVPARVLDK